MSRPKPERPGDHLPEAMEFAGWPPLGALSRDFDAGPVRVRLRRVDQDALDSLARWAGELPVPQGAAELELELELTRGERPHYLADPDPGEPLRLQTWEEEHGGFAMATHGAALLVDEACERGIAVLSPQPPERLDLSLQNLLRVAVAWRLARSGRGLLLHAAAVELAAGAVLLLGHSGAGKSTAAGLAGDRRVLADDVALLTRPRQADGDWLVHPHPLWAQADFPGRCAQGEPAAVAFACSLRHGKSASVEALPRSRAAVVAASCAPFLGASAEAFDPAGAAGALARALPAGVLTFAEDQPPWERLASAVDEAAAAGAPQGD